MKHGTFKQAFIYAFELTGDKGDFMLDYLCANEEGEDLFKDHPKYEEFLKRQTKPDGLVIVPEILEHLGSSFCSLETLGDVDVWNFYKDNDYLFSFYENEDDREDPAETLKEFLLGCLKHAHSENSELSIQILEGTA